MTRNRQLQLLADSEVTAGEVPQAEPEPTLSDYIDGLGEGQPCFCCGEPDLQCEAVPEGVLLRCLSCESSVLYYAASAIAPR